MNRFPIILLFVLALVAAACGDDSGGTSTTSGGAATTPPTTAETTVPAAETTTSTSGQTTTTASDQTTTTAGTSITAPASADAAIAVAKADAVAGAVPEGWTITVTDEMLESPEDDVLYDSCLEPGSFDLDNLDLVSVAAIQTRAVAPITALSPFASSASIETRVFQDEATAAEAYTVLETVLGTTTGRECIAGGTFDVMLAELPPGTASEYTAEELLLPGGDFGTRISYAIELEGQTFTFFVDLVAHRDGACTVYGTFMSFNEPFPTEIATGMFTAATDV